MKQIGIFEESKRLENLSQLGDSLEKLNKLINWSRLEGTLSRACQKEHEGAGGRPPYSYVLLFKVLMLQRLYKIADDETEGR